jgi:hypothetical protein
VPAVSANSSSTKKNNLEINSFAYGYHSANFLPKCNSYYLNCIDSNGKEAELLFKYAVIEDVIQGGGVKWWGCGKLFRVQCLCRACFGCGLVNVKAQYVFKCALDGFFC